MKLEVQRKAYYTNTKQNKTGEAILIPDKVDFKSRRIIRNKKIHLMVIKRSTHKEDITMYNSCSYFRVSKYRKQKWKGNIENPCHI